MQIAAAREMRRDAVAAMATWVAGLRNWDYFVTLTYDPVKVLRGRGEEAQRGVRYDNLGRPIRVGLSKMRRDVARFIKDAGDAVGGVDLVAGIEPHETGSLHAHALVKIVKGVGAGDIRALHAAWFPLHGFMKVENARDRNVRARYVTKYERVAGYTTKHQGDFVFSRGLRPLPLFGATV